MPLTDCPHAQKVYVPMSAETLDLRHLRYFVSVADHGSFSAASARLHISQPALTRQIQQIEERLNQTLLLRQARGVQLTEAGKVFYAEARNVLALMDQAVSRSKLAGDGELGRLDIGIFGSGIFVAIPRIVKAFHERHPGVQIALHTMDRAEQLSALRDRRLSLGFDSCFNEDPDVKWKTIQKERFKVAIHQSHRLAKCQTLSLADIANDPLIFYPRSQRPQQGTSMATLFHRRQLSPASIQEVDDVATAVTLVSCGFGLTLVAESACTLKMPGVLYRELEQKDRAEFDLCMMYRGDDSSALLDEFIRLACDKGHARTSRRSASARGEGDAASRARRGSGSNRIKG